MAILYLRYYLLSSIMRLIAVNDYICSMKKPYGCRVTDEELAILRKKAGVSETTSLECFGNMLVHYGLLYKEVDVFRYRSTPCFAKGQQYFDDLVQSFYYLSLEMIKMDCEKGLSDELFIKLAKANEEMRLALASKSAS